VARDPAALVRYERCLEERDRGGRPPLKAPSWCSTPRPPDPAGLVRFLDEAALAESGMKQYAVAAHALRRTFS